MNRPDNHEINVLLKGTDKLRPPKTKRALPVLRPLCLSEKQRCSCTFFSISFPCSKSGYYRLLFPLSLIHHQIFPSHRSQGEERLVRELSVFSLSTSSYIRGRYLKGYNFLYYCRLHFYLRRSRQVIEL